MCRNQREHYFDLGFIIICFVMYFIWSFIFPFGTGPDESMRYCIPKFIFDYGVLPRGDDVRIIYTGYGTSYAFSPYVANLPCVLLMKVVSFFSESDVILPYAARFSNVIISTLTAGLSVCISKKLFKGIYAKLFCVSVGLLPQFIYISSYINLDAFGVFTVSLILYELIVAEEKQWAKKNCFLLGIGIGLCFVSYYFCFGIILIAFLYALISVLKDDKIGNKRVFIVQRILIVIIPVLLLAGWWYIRNYLLYDGDFLGMRTSTKVSEIYAVDELKPSLRETPYNTGQTVWDMIFNTRWLRYVMMSFVGVFGWMSLFVSFSIYLFYYLVASVGITGNMIVGNINIDTVKNKKLFLTMMASMFGITFFISVIYSYFFDYQPQGRYLLPALLPLNIILVTGISKLLSPRSERVQQIVVGSIVVLYMIMPIICLVRYIAPVYAV